MVPEATAVPSSTFQSGAALAQLKYQLPKMQLYLVTEGGVSPPLHAVRTPDDVADYLAPIKHLAEEHFVALHLNSKHEIIGLHEVSHGTLSSSLVHPREVFKAALLANSHEILVCHNHPSGSPLSPSAEDLETTEHLLKAGKLMGVGLLDHVILSPLHEMYSIREHHSELWRNCA